MIYLGSFETSVCLMMRMASADVKGSNQFPLVWDVLSSTISSVDYVEQKDSSSETTVVCGYELASAVTMTRFGALWRSPHTLRISEWPRAVTDTPRCGN